MVVSKAVKEPGARHDALTCGQVVKSLPSIEWGPIPMPPLALTPAQQRRIAKLAELAGRTPAAMLRFVLRDGLEATEQDVRETVEADKDIDRNGAIPHRDVMAQARSTVERHAAKRRQKAA